MRSATVGREDDVTATAALYARYHGRMLTLARLAGEDGARKANLREVLVELDEDCFHLSLRARCRIRAKLASQIEQELLRFANSTKRAALAIALRHLD